MKFIELQKKYPQFVYDKYNYKIKGKDLEISFIFNVTPDIKFSPKIIIENINKSRIKKIRESTLDNLIFHLGLIEMISYWKATCSPKIIIKAGYLDKKQIKWWQDLIFNGMGQFFYENKIDFKKSDFLKIISTSNKYTPVDLLLTRRKRYLVPFREGKDSIVTLEKLKRQKKKINTFTVNPTKAAKKVLKVAGIKNPIIVERRIDPLLLKLNRQGYLNGHTPFTAVLSFLSVFCAVLFDYKHIAFSNEKSADEGNVKYLGRMINHQYSKSSEFEKKFKNYCQKYLTKNAHYFSFLRKYTELEIAKMFSKHSKYFSVFLSCNEAYKTDSGRKKPLKKWCGKCSKCLFVFTILYPFIIEKKLFKIFGKNLFEDKKLLPIMRELIGWCGNKPFECVGTYKESKKALQLCIKKAKKSKEIHYILEKFNVKRIKR